MENFKMLVLKQKDADEIAAFERAQLQGGEMDALEMEMSTWHAPWRTEALDHYLPMGWSFGVFDETQQGLKLRGYLLAQPLLFFRGMTQTLWVEYLSYDSEEVAHKLVEIAYRWSRDKHLQKLIVGDAKKLQFALKAWGARVLEDDLAEINTAKLKES